MSTATDLQARIATVVRSGRRPTDLVMSPETWREITRDSDVDRAVLDQPSPLTFDGISVTLTEGALGIAIVYREGVEHG